MRNYELRVGPPALHLHSLAKAIFVALSYLYPEEGTSLAEWNGQGPIQRGAKIAPEPLLFPSLPGRQNPFFGGVFSNMPQDGHKVGSNGR